MPKSEETPSALRRLSLCLSECVRFDTLTTSRAVQGRLWSLISYLPLQAVHRLQRLRNRDPTPAKYSHNSGTRVTHMPALRSTPMRAMAQLLLATAASGLLINPNGGLRTAGSPTLRAATSADALLQDADAYRAASVKEQAILGRVNAMTGVGEIDDLNAFNLGGSISKARELAELEVRSTLPYTSSCKPLASSTGRRRAMSTLSAWAFGSVACTAAATANQDGTLNSFSQSVGSTLGQQDGSAARDASAAPKADERPQSFKAEASSQVDAPAPEKPKPAPYVFDATEFNPTGFAPL